MKGKIFFHSVFISIKILEHVPTWNNRGRIANWIQKDE
jgi:hypothetical protein